MSATAKMNAGKARSSGYQVWVTALLSLNFGILFFDRNALNFLMPFVQPDLQLSNTQVGMFSSACRSHGRCRACSSGAFRTSWVRANQWWSSPPLPFACAHSSRALHLHS